MWSFDCPRDVEDRLTRQRCTPQLSVRSRLVSGRHLDALSQPRRSAEFDRTHVDLIPRLPPRDSSPGRDIPVACADTSPISEAVRPEVVPAHALVRTGNRCWPGVGWRRWRESAGGQKGPAQRLAACGTAGFESNPESNVETCAPCRRRDSGVVQERQAANPDAVVADDDDSALDEVRCDVVQVVQDQLGMLVGGQSVSRSEQVD